MTKGRERVEDKSSNKEQEQQVEKSNIYGRKISNYIKRKKKESL